MYCTVLYCTILCSTIIYYTMLYYAMLYCTIQYHTIHYTPYTPHYTLCTVYCTIHYTILYYAISYYTILYCTTLYYTILAYYLYQRPSGSWPRVSGERKRPEDGSQQLHSYLEWYILLVVYISLVVSLFICY